ncbi:hypothetical protein FOA52_010138 [Chlamydomonas sp. UWO 241]|nr:hypothetical protein FOA52_010138 [Chlamydomonas sp. UWO 241]
MKNKITAENAREINTRALRENHGWTGLLLDGGSENARINLHMHFILSDNIVGLFQRYNVSTDALNLLSVDLDRNDFYGYRPRVLVAEINRNFAAGMSYNDRNDTENRWDGLYYFGVSPLAYARLLRAYRYRQEPAGGSVVSASFLNAKPTVRGIGVDPRRGGV